jgi:tyrosinase
MSVNMGPCLPEVYPLPTPNPSSDCLGYNPRCIRRDMSNFFTMRDAKTSDIIALITNYTDVGSFQTRMQSKGVHGAGHFTVNGDPGADLYVTPADPAFWFHHSMIDRVWSIWQLQDFENRQQVISGGTIWRDANSTIQTLDDLVDLKILTDKVYKIKELVSTVDGPFCYAYE